MAATASPQTKARSSSIGDASAADFDLRTEIRQLLDNTELSDPREIANAILPQVPEALVRTLVANHLAEVAQSVMSYQRSNVLTGRSSKWASVAEQSDEIAVLRIRVFVGSEYKPLGRCTFSDLQFIVADHRQQAENLIARGRFYKVLAKQMREHGALVVADLPIDVLEASLNA